MCARAWRVHPCRDYFGKWWDSQGTYRLLRLSDKPWQVETLLSADQFECPTSGTVAIDFVDRAALDAVLKLADLRAIVDDTSVDHIDHDIGGW